MITVPIGALVVLHLTYSGLDQRALHARGREERTTVTDVYWVDQVPIRRPTSRGLLVRRDSRCRARCPGTA